MPPDVLLLPAAQSNMFLGDLGRRLGATPDGRNHGKPLADNLSPVPGACINGVTAMLNSVAGLPLHRVCSGALNIRLRPMDFTGDDGLSRLESLLGGFFYSGGMQIQATFTTNDELRDAMTRPELHRDLMVRVTGYSARFVDMSEQAQLEILRREELTL